MVPAGALPADEPWDPVGNRQWRERDMAALLGQCWRQPTQLCLAGIRLAVLARCCRLVFGSQAAAAWALALASHLEASLPGTSWRRSWLSDRSEPCTCSASSKDKRRRNSNSRGMVTLRECASCDNFCFLSIFVLLTGHSPGTLR